MISRLLTNISFTNEQNCLFNINSLNKVDDVYTFGLQQGRRQRGEQGVLPSPPMAARPKIFRTIMVAYKCLRGYLHS